LRAWSPGAWRADRCAAAGLPFGRAHALYRRALHGGQAQHDRLEAHKIAVLLRGGLLPHASVDPRRRRATRELLRRRNHLRPKRAEWSAHLHKTARQSTRGAPMGRSATPPHRRGLLARVEHRGGQQTMAVDVALVDCDEPLRADVERSIAKIAHGQAPGSRARWRTIPGVGNILALGRRYALEASARVPRGQAFVSDGRLVQRARASNGTRHGPSGTKSGNAPRTWAFSEAAGRVRKHHAPATQDLTQSATRPGQGQARSILAHTRGRAVSCRRKPQAAFNQEPCLATSGGRALSSLAAHGRHRGPRHPTGASRRALRRVGHAPAPAVPGPTVTPGLRSR
jgi:hypothetical protein